MKGDAGEGAEHDRLQALNADKHRRYVIKGGTVVSMTGTGVMVNCDILVEGNRIAAVGPDLGVDTATPVIDATDMIVIPGFQDTHRHCWQTSFRRYLAGAGIGRYFDAMHLRVGPACRPEDLYAGNALAAATALDGGVTTLLDFSHNCRSEEHTDAAIDALGESGIRSVFAYGAPLSGAWKSQWPGDLSRVQQAARSAGGLMDVRLAVLADDGLVAREMSLAPETIRTAREAGVGIIADAAIETSSSDNIVALGRADLLGPDVTLIHCTGLQDEAWRAIADSGTCVSLCPTSDMQIGLGGAVPPIQQVLDMAVVAGLSVDVECCLSSDMFAQMQATYTIQRVGAFAQAKMGAGNAPAPISPLDVLHLATCGGACVNGLRHKAGTVEVGKLADLVMIGANDLNTMPLNDAVATVVLGAGPQNVDTVIVDGRFRKAGGLLLDIDIERLRALTYESRDYLVRESAVDALKT